MAKEEKVVVDEATKEEIKTEILENKEELKTRKGFKAFAKKWAKILLLPLTAVIALIILIAKGIIFGGKDDDELMEEPAADNDSEAA